MNEERSRKVVEVFIVIAGMAVLAFFYVLTRQFPNTP